MRHGGRGRHKIPRQRELNREERHAPTVKLCVSYDGKQRPRQTLLSLSFTKHLRGETAWIQKSG